MLFAGITAAGFVAPERVFNERALGAAPIEPCAEATVRGRDRDLKEGIIARDRFNHQDRGWPF